MMINNSIILVISDRKIWLNFLLIIKRINWYIFIIDNLKMKKFCNITSQLSVFFSLLNTDKVIFRNYTYCYCFYILHNWKVSMRFLATFQRIASAISHHRPIMWLSEFVYLHFSFFHLFANCKKCFSFDILLLWWVKLTYVRKCILGH